MHNKLPAFKTPICDTNNLLNTLLNTLLSPTLSLSFEPHSWLCSSGSELKRLDYRVGEWDRDFAAYLSGLRDRKPVLLCGDLNCAHMDIDIHSPKTNQRSAGFTVVGTLSCTPSFEELGEAASLCRLGGS